MTENVFFDDPAAVIAAHYAQVWASTAMPEATVNRRLQVAALDFVRCQGDWLGAVVAPWAIHLILINGGGHLWGEIPPGQRRYLALPGGTLAFVAAGEPEIGTWQYASLCDSTTAVADMKTARLIAADGLRMALGFPGAADEPITAPRAPVSRRGFLRRLAGKPA
jgi:[NiFe] hydrogenase assembly HybE family chaperone